MPPGTDQSARVSRAVGVSAQATRLTLAVSTSSSGRGSELRDAGVGVLGCPGPRSFRNGWRGSSADRLSRTLSSSALPSSRGPAFPDKGALGDEMLAAALLKAKAQVSHALPFFPFPLCRNLLCNNILFRDSPVRTAGLPVESWTPLSLSLSSVFLHPDCHSHFPNIGKCYSTPN